MLTWIWIFIGLLTFIFLIHSRFSAPYGRHTRKGWGMLISNRWGWVIMELPALLTMPIITLSGSHSISRYTYLLLALWLIHYGHRTLVFPFKIKTRGKKMPLSIVFSAIVFNAINGTLNGYFLGYLVEGSSQWHSTFSIVGLGLFFTGMIINMRSDYYLIGLRKSHDGYQIPRGGLFRFVSCPNHFGEILEWIGFAIAAWNLAALSFALWTCFNLVPRALNHHHWYKEHFLNYPSRRKAVIPFIA